MTSNIICKCAFCVLFPTTLLLAGCDDFLERSSQTLVVPKTIAQYKEILQGEGYFRDLLNRVNPNNHYMFIQFMTDDVELFDVTTYSQCPAGWSTSKTGELEDVERYMGCYCWDVSIESARQPDKAYLYLYRQAMVANVCLQDIEKIEGTAAEKEVLRGQAAFTRAFAYFMLANIYAKPYSQARPDDLCVPLKTDPTPIVETYSRATIEQVWGQINEDIGIALQDLKEKNLERNIYEISYPTALILAQRIALYMEDWPRAVAYGREYMESYASKYPIYDISGKDTAGPRSADKEYNLYVEKFINSQNTEIVWNFSGGSTYRTTYIISPGELETKDNMGKYYRVSSIMPNNLMSCYQPGDRRLAYWFFHPTGAGIHSSARFDYIIIKDDNDFSLKKYPLYLSQAFRSSEVYLSLAEALARKPQPEPEEAVELLNDLRQKRFNPSLYTPLTAGDFADADTLTRYIWTERRRELCFEENHRWWDLRRTTRPRIVHPWKGRTAYILEENDPGYTLNFPDVELTFNGSTLTPNRRPQRASIPYSY
jgi:hypothetical protein